MRRRAGQELGVEDGGQLGGRGAVDLAHDDDVAHDAGEAGNDPRRFDPPDRVDRAVSIRDVGQ